MSVGRHIKSALSPIAPVEADEYTGDRDTYITFNYNTTPDDFADGAPGHEVLSVQVHLFCPNGVNSVSMRRSVKKSLVDAGFDWPSCVNASDRDSQHYVFEFETAQAVGVE